MSFIIFISFYYCRRIVYFVTDIDTFIVTYVPEDVTAVSVITYVAYVLCAVMMSAYMSTFGVHTVIGSKIGVHTKIGSNTSEQVHYNGKKNYLLLCKL